MGGRLSAAMTRSLARVATGLLLFQGAISAAAVHRPMDDFRSSCDPKSMRVEGKYATAFCRTLKGELRCSRLDLSPCIKNNQGNLQSDPTGAGPSFFNECYGCSNDPATSGLLINGPTVLHCRCDPKTGIPRPIWPMAIMDINGFIDNTDGVMHCYGNPGVSQPARSCF